MPSQPEIDHTLETITASLNRSLDTYDTARAQEIIDEACGATHKLTVDDGGGLHDQRGTRIAAIRRASGGEWITERQNVHALHATAPIPAAS